MLYSILFHKMVKRGYLGYDDVTDTYTKEMYYDSVEIMTIQAHTGSNRITVEVQENAFYTNYGISFYSQEAKAVIKTVMKDLTLAPLLFDILLENEIDTECGINVQGFEAKDAYFLSSEQDQDESHAEWVKTRNSPIGLQYANHGYRGRRTVGRWEEYHRPEARIIPERHENMTPEEIIEDVLDIPPEDVAAARRLDSLRWMRRPYHTTVMEDNNVHYFHYTDLLMIDWDVDDGSHFDPERQCLVDSIGDAWETLHNFCEKNPEYKFVMYQTPGGARAFCISHRIKALSDEAGYLMDELKCDKIYVDITQQRGNFACRLTPKIGREGDYVARFIGYLGNGDADDSLLNRVSYHDTWCANFGGGKKDTIKPPTKMFRPLPF